MLKNKKIKAQATTEYTVFMIFVVLAVTTIGFALKNKLSNFVNKYVNLETIFNPRSMHTKYLPKK